jgi:hypothetical protein
MTEKDNSSNTHSFTSNDFDMANINKTFNWQFLNWMRVRSFGMITLPLLLISLCTTLIFIQGDYIKFYFAIIETLIWFLAFISHSFLIYTTKDGITNQTLYNKIGELEKKIVSKVEYRELEGRLEKQILTMDKTQQEFNIKIVDRLDSILNLMENK